MRAAFVVTASAAAGGCDESMTATINPPPPPECDADMVIGAPCQPYQDCGFTNRCGNYQYANCGEAEVWEVPKARNAHDACASLTPCTPSDVCPEGEYCEYGDGLCGTGAPGACQTMPFECEVGSQGQANEMCGCNGQLAGVKGSCALAQAGIDTWRARDATCSNLQTFACGETETCTVDEVCHVGPMLANPSCVPLGTTCELESPCGEVCVGELGACTCETDVYGHPIVTCPE
ncbi:MAG: hypothetical protein HOV80_37625 [Polyangiaceae bacterium]|nr:hypothetical protein [Polyangiaceae bacterium]